MKPVWAIRHKYCFLICLLLGSTPAVHADHDNGIQIKFGGRIKVDTIYNNNSVSTSRKSKSDLAFTPRSIPLSDTQGDTDFNLRESRIWSTVTLPMASDVMSGYIEFDFFDTKRDVAGVSHVTNSPRLRHLYTNYGGWTLGKTYTNFVNMSAYPEINDANGPVGIHAIRQMLFRYRQELNFAEVAVSLEHGESTFVSSSGNRYQVNDDQLPDLVARISFVENWGQLSFAAMARQLHTNGRSLTGSNNKSWGGAVSVAGRIFISGQDNLRFAVSGGNALGRYLSYNAFDDASVSVNGDLDLSEAVSGHVAYQHWWTGKLRSSLVIGAGYANINTDITGNNINKVLASSTLNLIWSPDVNSTVGIEWLHGYRQQYDDQDGHIDRIQFSFIYTFK